jgi:hypothetical protein
MSDYQNMRAVWSYVQDDDPRDNRPSFAVIIIAIIFVLAILG